MRETSTALEQVRGWKKNIKERLDGFQILDKIDMKTTEVSIETWEAMCNSVEAIFNAVQKACENRWSASN